MTDDPNVRAHPRMHVALHRNHDLLAREAAHFGIALGRLRFVPLLIDLGQRVDIVVGGIIVADLDVLTGHHADHVGLVHAALLIEYDGAGGRGPLAIGHTGLHPHE